VRRYGLRAGARWTVASAFAFSVMSLLVKVAGARLPSQEIVAARALVTLVLSWALLRRAGTSVWGVHRRLLLVRGGVGYLALSCVYFALTRLPLADATVLQYLYPTFTGVLAAALLGEHLGAVLPGAGLASLAGTVLVARPPALFGHHAAVDPGAAGIAVLGAFLTAVAYVVVRRLGADEDPLVIVFYFPLVTLPATLPALWRHGVWPRGDECLVLLGVGVATQFGQVWLTRALAVAPAGPTAALAYVQVAFAALWGVLVFGEIPSPLTLAGAALIMAGALVAALQRVPPEPPEPTSSP
jgi:drug/metabolite transporter (DMT)-like permease